MYKLKIGKKGLEEAAEKEKGVDLVAGYTETPEKRCSGCLEFKKEFGEYPRVCPECDGRFKPFNELKKEVLKDEDL